MCTPPCRMPCSTHHTHYIQRTMRAWVLHTRSSIQSQFINSIVAMQWTSTSWHHAWGMHASMGLCSRSTCHGLTLSLSGQRANASSATHGYSYRGEQRDPDTPAGTSFGYPFHHTPVPIPGIKIEGLGGWCWVRGGIEPPCTAVRMARNCVWGCAWHACGMCVACGAFIIV